MNSTKGELGLFPDSAGGPTKPRSARPHDRKNLHVTLKQWRALHAVIDCGGFCEAADALHLSQSSISYAISKLQRQLGIPMLKITGRKAELTDEGRALLGRSRNLLGDAMALENFAFSLGRAQHAEIRMAIDPDFPASVLPRALCHLADLGHDIKVALRELNTAQIEDVLRSCRIDLAVTSDIPAGFASMPIFQFDYVAVANTRQRLYRLQRELHPEDFEGEMEIVIASTREEQFAERFRNVAFQSQRWHVGSIDTAIQALSGGIGYAWLPRHRIQPSLDNGLLALLPLKSPAARSIRLFLTYPRPPAEHSSIKLLVRTMQEMLLQDEGKCALSVALLQTISSKRADLRKAGGL